MLVCILLLWFYTNINVIYSIRCGHDDVEYDITRNDHIEPKRISSKLFNPLASLSSTTGATKWLLNKLEDKHRNIETETETHISSSNIANQNDPIQTFSSRKNTKPHRHHTSPHAFEHNKHNRHYPLPNMEYINEPIDEEIDSEIWKPFRIHYNSDSLVSSWHNKQEANHFAENVIPAAMHYLERSLYVRPIEGKLKLSRPCSKYIIDEKTNKKKCISLKWNWEQCGSHVTIPKEDFEDTEICELLSDNDELSCKIMSGGTGHDSDIIIYFSGDGDYGCSDVYGYSAYCHSNKYDRPIGGFVNLCEDTLVQKNRIFTWEQKVTLVVHEVFHVLGFSSTGFAYFRYNNDNRTPRTPRDNKLDGHPLKKSSGDYMYGSNTIQYHKIRDKFATFIVLPTVIKYAQKFYECSNVIGIELEDFGGHDTAASHWEQRILGYEFMIGYIPPAAPFSIFSFAVLHDSGWYKINWKYASLHPYGRKFGCDWIDKKCLSTNNNDNNYASDMLDPLTFCTSDIDYGCSKDHIAISNCQIEEYKFNLPNYFQYFGHDKNSNLGGRLEYADYCPMYYHYNNGDCRFIDASIKHKRFGATITPQSKCIIISHPDYHYLNLKMQGLNGNAITNDEKDDNDNAAAAHIPMFKGGRRRRKKPLPKELGVCYKQICFTDNKFAWSGLRIEIWNMEYEESEWITCWAGIDDGKYKITQLHEYDIRCPIYTDICYDNNPWLCNGHGILNKKTNKCICNAGYIGCDCLYDDTKQNRLKYPYSDHKKCQQYNIIKQAIFDKPPVHTKGNTLDILHDIIWNEIDVHFNKINLKLKNINLNFLKDKKKYINKNKNKNNEKFNTDFIQIAKTIKLLIAIPLKIDINKVWITNYKINHENENNNSIDFILTFQNQQKMNNKQLKFQIHKIFYKLFDKNMKIVVTNNNNNNDSPIENAQIDYKDNDDDDDTLGITTSEYMKHNSNAYIINITFLTFALTIFISIYIVV